VFIQTASSPSGSIYLNLAANWPTERTSSVLLVFQGQSKTKVPFHFYSPSAPQPCTGYPRTSRVRSSCQLAGSVSAVLSHRVERNPLDRRSPAVNPTCPPR